MAGRGRCAGDAVSIKLTCERCGAPALEGAILGTTGTYHVSTPPRCRECYERRILEEVRLPRPPGETIFIQTHAQRKRKDP